MRRTLHHKKDSISIRTSSDRVGKRFKNNMGKHFLCLLFSRKDWEKGIVVMRLSFLFTRTSMM